MLYDFGLFGNPFRTKDLLLDEPFHGRFCQELQVAFDGDGVPFSDSTFASCFGMIFRPLLWFRWFLATNLVADRNVML